jgi:ArsR family transcriptional regulator, arsenate/arsenite/antimonite-responsive transcriptional repressor
MKPVLHDAMDERLMVMLRALANPARLQIFNELRRGDELLCQDLVEGLPLSQSTVSEHLQRLREAGLIRAERPGASRRYLVDEDALAWLKERVAGL